MIPVSTQVAVWVCNNRDGVFNINTVQEALDYLECDNAALSIYRSIISSKTASRARDYSEELAHKRMRGSGFVVKITGVKGYVIFDGILIEDPNKEMSVKNKVAEWILENEAGILSAPNVRSALECIGIKGAVNSIFQTIVTCKTITIEAVESHSKRGGKYRIISIGDTGKKEVTRTTSRDLLSVKW